MHIPGAVLMENAGRGGAACLLEQLKNPSSANVVLFCGSGNNGGDGFVIARHLANAGVRPTLVLCGRRERIGGEAQLHLAIAEAMGLDILPLRAGNCVFPAVRELTKEADWIVDALLGTGLEGMLSEEMAGLICAINAVKKPILAVDIPSGLDCDEGVPLPVCIQAAVTVTFAALKEGFVRCPASRQATGTVYAASIGISASFWKARQKKGG
jgi:NAD(P)H-hydrate epimerase